MNKVIYIIILVCLLFTGNCIASTISTAIKNGNTLYLTSVTEDFEADASPGPLVYENFDANDTGRQNTDELKGNNCSNSGAWVDEFNDFIPIYTNSNNRAGSTLCGYHKHDVTAAGGDEHAPASIDFSETTETTILMSLWIRYTWSTWDNSGGNYKMYRINGGSETDDDLFLHCGSGNNDPDKGFFVISANIDYKTWPATGTTGLNFTYANDSGWEQHIMMVKASDSGVSNGSAIIWRDGIKLEDTSVMNTWDTGQDWKRFTVGWDVVNYDSGVWEMYTDDIYIDNTWRSVWLCNSATWATATQRELQITTQRTTGAIETNYNAGAFTTEDVYAIEIDSNGIPSNGVLVTTASSTGGSPATLGAGSVVNLGAGSAVNIYLN